MKERRISFHIFVSLISIILTLTFAWLIKNWQAESVIHYIKIAETFVDKHILLIEFLMIIMTVTAIQVLVRLIRHYKKGSMATASGMFFFRPNSTQRQIRKSENFLRKESLGCGFLYIGGATGWETFGSSGSPLYEAVKSCRDVRIILIYPLSPFVSKRVGDLQPHDPIMTISEYKRQIYASIDFLHSARKASGRPESLVVKMYQGYPFWKYVILDNYAWVQQYPRDNHVRSSPSYAFQRLPHSNKGIYDHLVNQFLMYWENHYLGLYNFENECLEFFDESQHMITTKPIR